MGEQGDLGEGWEKVGPGLVPEKCNLQYLLLPLAPQVRLLGHSPVLRNITNARAPGGWKRSEAPDQTAHSSEEDKENVRLPQARVGILQGGKGHAGVVLWHVMTPPPPAHRMDLSSRCHGSPHIPTTPMLWLSGPTAEKPLPRGQARPPT